MGVIFTQSSFMFPFLGLVWNIHAHWILAKANWTLFKESVTLLTEPTLDNVNNIADCFITSILSAILVSTGKACYPPVTRVTALHTWKRALSQLHHHLTMENIITYKKTLIQNMLSNTDSNKSSWGTYVSSLSDHTSSMVV